MTYNVIVSLEALSEVNEGAKWYDEQTKDLGLEFILEFYEASGALSELPNIHPFLRKPIREKLMKKFPFAIYFKVFDKKRQVLVAAVWHQSRNPDRLLKRLKL